jgi:hypothetical protein
MRTAVTGKPMCLAAEMETVQNVPFMLFVLMRSQSRIRADEDKSINNHKKNYLSTLKNGVFWVVTPCGSCKNRRFGGTWRLLHQGDKNR